MGLDLDAIWSNLPIPAMVLSKDRVIIGLNPAAEDLLACSSNQVCGENVAIYFGTGSRILDLIAQAVDGPSNMVQYDVEMSWNDRRIRLGTLQANVIRSDGSILILMNPRGLAEKMDRSLGYRSAARSVTGMAAMLAHEIRNPLAGISGAAQLLAMNLDEQDQEMTRLIQEETQRIGELVQRVEAFGDQGPFVAEPVNIHDVLDRTIRAARVGFASHVKFVETYDPSLPPTSGDAAQLAQVFQNILKNAAEAIREKGGVITVSTSFRPGVRLRIPGTKSSGLPLEIAIRDNGCGIPPELIDDIFDPFVTTKAAGSGLGLSLVSKIIATHGGVIECQPLDRGTLFKVLLSVWEGPAAEVAN